MASLRYKGSAGHPWTFPDIWLTHREANHASLAGPNIGPGYRSKWPLDGREGGASDEESTQSAVVVRYEPENWYAQALHRENLRLAADRHTRRVSLFSAAPCY